MLQLQRTHGVTPRSSQSSSHPATSPTSTEALPSAMLLDNSLRSALPSATPCHQRAKASMLMSQAKCSEDSSSSAMQCCSAAQPAGSTVATALTTSHSSSMLARDAPTATTSPSSLSTQAGRERGLLRVGLPRPRQRGASSVTFLGLGTKPPAGGASRSFGPALAVCRHASKMWLSPLTSSPPASFCSVGIRKARWMSRATGSWLG
mmetsp:Transcript_32654/g.75916  ORF Transcript_32654/g.75916 Transcript_32654/m.75916 type:complete len:206 (+) Transcript_32654:125-742(+)